MTKARTKKKKNKVQRVDPRRLRYAKDAEYREHIKQRERERYRERREAEGKPVAEREHGANAGHASSYSAQHVGLNGKRISGMSVKQMADFLDMSDSGLRAWIRTERFPAPVVEVQGGFTVYTPTQANKLARILNKQLGNAPTLRSTDTEIIEALFAAI